MLQNPAIKGTLDIRLRKRRAMYRAFFGLPGSRYDTQITCTPSQSISVMFVGDTSSDEASLVPMP